MWTRNGNGNGNDNGNGAIVYCSRSTRYPNVVKIDVKVYAKGRGENETYYRIDGDPSTRTFATAAAAQVASSHLSRIPTETLRKELASRR